MLPDGRCMQKCAETVEKEKAVEIKKFAEEANINAVNHGWWNGSGRSFGELIALCHFELSEALEEYRAGHAPDETYYACKKNANIAFSCNGKCEECQYAKMEGVPSELADVVIRVLDMAEYYGIDIEKALMEKHEFNKIRSYRHGGKTL